MLGKQRVRSVRRAAAVALAVPAALVMLGPATPAVAAPHVLTGATTVRWNYSPALGVLPTPTLVFADLGLVGITDDTPPPQGLGVDLGTDACLLSGSGTESLAVGQGVVSGGCTSTGTVNSDVTFPDCTVFYARVGALVELNGTCSVSTGQTATLTGVLAWEYTGGTALSAGVVAIVAV